MANNFESGQNPVEATAANLQGNIHSPIQEFQTATAQLWTTAEFLEAEPYPIPTVSEEDLKAMTEAVVEVPQGIAGTGNFEVGGLPTVGQPTDETPTATSGGYNYPGPFTRHEVLCSYSIYPYITVGKIFFKQYGTSYVASASSIGNYAIWTAGHCIHAGDGKPEGWSTNLVYVPAYKDGNAPFGQWPASSLITKTKWYQNGIPNGLCADMGGAVLFPNNAGRKISEVVGWLGFAWNWSRYQHWHLIGYPAAPPFDGKKMIETEASYAYDGDIPCSPKPVGVGCDMTGGCSGGPWILGFGTGNWLNGDNSYRDGSKPQELFSPYLDDAAKSLWDALTQGKP